MLGEDLTFEGQVAKLAYRGTERSLRHRAEWANLEGTFVERHPRLRFRGAAPEGPAALRRAA
jgi:hypothetical protein